MTVLRDLFRKISGDPVIESSGQPRLIVGLGNPGGKYAATRHNIGFRIVDQISDRLPGGRERSRFDAALYEIHDAGAGNLVLVKPMTMMNLSGRAVAQIQRWYGVPARHILLIYDDLDLALGRIRIRPGGGAGGHNGVQSVIEELKTSEFPRIRVGIGRPTQGSTVNYVLSHFRTEEQETVDRVISMAADAALTWARSGIDEAMNAYNRRDVGSGKSEPAASQQQQHQQ